MPLTLTQIQDLLTPIQQEQEKLRPPPPEESPPPETVGTTETKETKE